MARRGSFLASDDDREQIVDRLRKAAAEGRLAVHEFEQRVATALRARTYAELDATVRDLPGAPRQGLARSAPRSVARTVSAHPALLILAIPVVMIAVATLIAITVLWSVLALAFLLLGHRRAMWRGPWMYAGQRRYGPPRGPYWDRGSYM